MDNRTKYKTLDGPEGDLLEEDMAVLDWVVRYVGSMGYPPSVRELVDAFRLSSTKTAFDILHRLSAFGFLDVDPGVTRGIRLTSLPPLADQAAARLRLWIAEAAALLGRHREDDPAVAKWLAKVAAVTL